MTPVSKLFACRTRADGTTSSPAPFCAPDKPPTSPNDDGLKSRLFEDQPICSPLRPMYRPTLKPQTSFSESNDSVLNGISISAIQPVSVIWASPCQIPRQFQFSDVTFS